MFKSTIVTFFIVGTILIFPFIYSEFMDTFIRGYFFNKESLSLLYIYVPTAAAIIIELLKSIFKTEKMQKVLNVLNRIVIILSIISFILFVLFIIVIACMFMTMDEPWQTLESMKVIA